MIPTSTNKFAKHVGGRGITQIYQCLLFYPSVYCLMSTHGVPCYRFDPEQFWLNSGQNPQKTHDYELSCREENQQKQTYSLENMGWILITLIIQFMKTLSRIRIQLSGLFLWGQLTASPWEHIPSHSGPWCTWQSSLTPEHIQTDRQTDGQKHTHFKINSAMWICLTHQRKAKL